MEKIAIVGSPGAGKTTFATELRKILNIKVFHLDRLFWDRDWKRKSRDARIEILDKIVREKQWIIEGTYLSSSEPRLEEADTIIFLDMLPLLCLQRIIARHQKNRGEHRRDLPIDTTDKLTRGRMCKVITFPLTDRKKLELILHKYASKRIIRLSSSKEVADFLNKQKKDVQETPSIASCFQPTLKLAET